MQPTSTLKRTPFYAHHAALGAKLVDFAGFEMPLRYAGDIREHLKVRTDAGLFDISHMGEFEVRGPGATEFVHRVMTNDMASLAVGQALYSPMCREDGGIVDDLVLYRYADRYMLVVNAANIAKDWAWLQSQKSSGVEMHDRSEETALLAVQGRRSAEMLDGVAPAAGLELGFYRFCECELFGVPVTFSRTGYTGEDGFEIYFAPAHADRVWDGLVEAGRRVGMEPVGLGARDTLRLEMGYMLYGNDLTDATSPLEAGLSWTVKLDRGDFLGRDALLRQKQAGLERKLVGLESVSRRVPRHGMKILAGAEPVGEVTSGSYSPSLERGIAMGYVKAERAALGMELEVEAGGQRVPVRVVRRPFYTRGSHR